MLLAPAMQKASLGTIGAVLLARALLISNTEGEDFCQCLSRLLQQVAMAIAQVIKLGPLQQLVFHGCC